MTGPTASAMLRRTIAAGVTPVTLWGTAGERLHMGSGRDGQWLWWSGHCPCGPNCFHPPTPPAHATAVGLSTEPGRSLGALTEHLQTTAFAHSSNEALSNWITHPHLRTEDVDAMLRRQDIHLAFLESVVGRALLDPVWDKADTARLTATITGRVAPLSRPERWLDWLATTVLPTRGLSQWLAVTASLAPAWASVWVEAALVQPAQWWAAPDESVRRGLLLHPDRRVREMAIRTLQEVPAAPVTDLPAHQTAGFRR